MMDCFVVATDFLLVSVHCYLVVVVMVAVVPTFVLFFVNVGRSVSCDGSLHAEGVHVKPSEERALPSEYFSMQVAC